MLVKILNGTKYVVREDGKIFTSNGKELVTYKNSKGYDIVDLRISGKTTRQRVDYVVANSFFPLIEEDGEVIHLDYNINNNYYTNLQWVSFKTDKAIDALDNDCLILCVDVFTSNLILFYRGERHLCIKNKITIDILMPHLQCPIYPINNRLFYNLSDINIIEVNTAYMVFEVKNKMCIIRYDLKIMYELVKLLKNDF